MRCRDGRRENGLGPRALVHIRAKRANRLYALSQPPIQSNPIQSLLSAAPIACFPLPRTHHPIPLQFPPAVLDLTPRRGGKSVPSLCLHSPRHYSYLRAIQPPSVHPGVHTARGVLAEHSILLLVVLFPPTTALLASVHPTLTPQSVLRVSLKLTTYRPQRASVSTQGRLSSVAALTDMSIRPCADNQPYNHSVGHSLMPSTRAPSQRPPKGTRKLPPPPCATSSMLHAALFPARTSLIHRLAAARGLLGRTGGRGR
ncbi:hypothetical protein C8Q70DRAFT_59351 [Cubamyces menziesii]|nr:hypothetical protein C8Q70DRAFT_59351 [Cubamyces menziesii]